MFGVDAEPPACLAEHVPSAVRKAARDAGCSNPAVCVRHMVAFYRGLPADDPRRVSPDWQSRAVAWFAGHGGRRKACVRSATDADQKRDADGRARERRAVHRAAAPAAPSDTDHASTEGERTALPGRLSDALAAALGNVNAAGKGK